MTVRIKFSGFSAIRCNAHKHLVATVSLGALVLLGACSEGTSPQAEQTTQAPAPAVASPSPS